MAIDTSKVSWDLYEGQSENNPEHSLYIQTVVEYNDIAGHFVEYFVRYDADNTDRLYGETPEQIFYTAKNTKVVYEPTEELSMMNQFGITSDETIQYMFMPQATFKRDISTTTEPMPGDVIKALWNDRSYEIVDVGQEAKMFLYRKHMYEFIMRPFRFSSSSDWDDEITTTTDPLSAFGDNDWIEEASNDIDSYTDVDTTIYGYN